VHSPHNLNKKYDTLPIFSYYRYHTLGFAANRCRAVQYNVANSLEPDATVGI